MSVEELINNNLGIAHAIAWSYFNKPNNIIEFDDIRQIAYEGLVKAANTYDETKSQFSTYAYNVIRNEFNMYFKKLTPIGTNIVYLDDKIINLGDKTTSSLSFNDLLVNDDIDNEILDNINKSTLHQYINELSYLYRTVLTFYLNNLTQKEIAEKLNISQSSVSSIYRKAINKLRDKFKI